MAALDATVPAQAPAESTAPLPARHRRRSPIVVRATVAGIVLVWTAVFVAAPYLEPNPEVHRAALFAHLAALVLGFGAVLTVDWFGLMWLLRRGSLVDVLRVAHGAHAPIWLGLAGLTASGVVLSPDTSSPLTVIKLLAVLAVAVNGLHARHVQERMNALEGTPPPRGLLLRGALAVGVSQAGWWTATTVGFINSQS
ncbi:MAG TPA: hypothetical protein VFT95_02485 [Micromonosporaceae bacterium]|nr:hypothetical protein [Micromonosporaceae bacterium]